MISARIYQLLFLLAATLISVDGFSQKALADSVITKNVLQYYVQALAHDSMEGRYTGTAGCEKAADWIAKEMQAIGLKPHGTIARKFHQSYYIANGKDTIRAANIVGIIPGRISNKYIVFSAHYDHVGDAGKQINEGQLHPSEADKIYNGANDNASGVAALLALANYFSLLNSNDYTLIFIAFSGEEDGLIGSSVFVKSFGNLKNIKQVVNLEMLGRFPSDSSRPFVTEGINSYGFQKKINRYLRQMDPAADKQSFQHDRQTQESYFYRSDNISFAIKGVPANTIMAGNGSDSFYHSPSDEWDTLNYEAMTRVVKTIALACTALVQK